MSALCACGCGKPAAIASVDRPRLGHVKGQPTEYARGHNRLTSSNKVWYSKPDGRTVVHDRDRRNYYWYRIVMWNELGRELRRDEDVHHINGDRADDRVENLLVLSRREHFAIHRAQGERGHVIANLRAAAQRSNRARSKKVTLACASCGTTFERSPAHARPGKLGVHFCTPRCHYDFRFGTERPAA